jgi:hypothetical protein
MTSSPEQINEMLKVLDTNRSIIETDINTLVYYMNGGLDYNDAWLLTLEQRKRMSQVIQRHFDAMNPKKGSQL